MPFQDCKETSLGKSNTENSYILKKKKKKILVFHKREIPLKTTMKCHFHLIRVARIIKFDDIL